MPVMNSNGELFDERRKEERRKLDIPVETDRRVNDRRVEDLNKSNPVEETENSEALSQEEHVDVTDETPTEAVNEPTIENSEVNETTVQTEE